MQQIRILVASEPNALVPYDILYRALVRSVDTVHAETTHCVTGKDAVSHAIAACHFGQAFNLIILDDFHSGIGNKDRPELTAEEAIRMLRVMRAYKDTPIVTIARYVAWHMKQAGATAWVLRTASEEELSQAIRAAQNPSTFPSASQLWGLYRDFHPED